MASLVVGMEAVMPNPVKLDAPCECGSRIAFWMVSVGDPEAEELPIILRCAACNALLATMPTVAEQSKSA